MAIPFSLIVFLVNPFLDVNEQLRVQVKHIDDKQNDKKQKDKGKNGA